MTNQIYKFDTDQVWFTSDTHFGHENIIRFCGRPFHNAAEMNAELIRRWRETVPDDGIVFHLGDFAHGGSRLWNDIICALTGRIYLVLGNHDIKNLRQGFMNHFELVTQQITIRVNGQHIILNHNPFLCYGGSYRDVWQLFGHVHSGPMSHTGLDHPRLKMLFPLQYDVGVDNNDFRPVSFAEVKSKIEAQVSIARAAAGITDDSKALNERKIVFIDKGCFIGPKELERLNKASTDIIELDIADPSPVKETIAQHISLLTGNIRHVYIGSRLLDDFRSVHIGPETPITMSDIKAAIKKL